MSGQQTPTRNKPLIWQGNSHLVNNYEGHPEVKNKPIVWQGNGHLINNNDGHMEGKKQASPPKLKSGVFYGDNNEFGNIEESKIIRQG